MCVHYLVVVFDVSREQFHQFREHCLRLAEVRVMTCGGRVFHIRGTAVPKAESLVRLCSRHVSDMIT